MARARRKKKNELGEEIEVHDDEQGFLDEDMSEDEAAEEAPKKKAKPAVNKFEQAKTFAEQDGTPGNKHAKELARMEQALKKREVPRGSFYTAQGKKVLKIMVKADRVLQVYVGNLVRHKDGLDPVIARWKKEGHWVEPHAVKAKIAALRAELKK
jgi:hypothetical protein